MKLPDFESEYNALFNAIRKVVPPSMKIYLVGGAVRDFLLERKIHDFDFCVEGLVRPIGKHIADELGGAYYVLDDEREMVRVIVDDEQMGQFDIDIALISGGSIEEDLNDRDFTVNAMAIEIGSSSSIVDPLHGYDDLLMKRLRMCNPESLKNDPLRALRAIRMCLEYDLQMDDELLNAMSSVISRMSESSIERYRDEMFKTIRLYKNGKAIKLYEKYGYINHLFPTAERKFENINSQWIENSDLFVLLLTKNNQIPDKLDDFVSYAVSRLGNYREALRAFFDKTLALYHNRRMLTLFSVIAKTLSEDIETILKWSAGLAFSSSEQNFVRSALLSFDFLTSFDITGDYGDVTLYRYFRQFKEGGIAGLILFLSHEYSLQNVSHAYKDWCDKVVFVQDMITAYFTRYNDVIAPKPFMSGHDIQETLNAPAGPMIGFIKNALIEAQIRGSVKSMSEAESFVRQQAKHYSQ